MSVVANKSMNEYWARLEGRVVNGALPLRRCIGTSDHSGVFLTESAKRSPVEVAIKLIPAVPALAEAQFSRWRVGAALAHPHLMRMFEAGRCQLDSVHYLYVVMEYSDQNLAQLLESRALTEDEVREMLVPTLKALSSLHEKKFVQGQLKPSNVLVVGDQIKLASDTIRPANEVRDGLSAMSVYDPPEARDGVCSAAGDMWALGVMLSEALVRRQPSGLHDSSSVVLSSDFPPAYRGIVARCLSRKPQDRPRVVDLEGWLRGEAVRPAPTPAVSQSAGESDGPKTVPRESVQPNVASREKAAPPAAVVSGAAVPAAAASMGTAGRKPGTIEVVTDAPVQAQVPAPVPAPAPAPASASASAPATKSGSAPRAAENRDAAADHPSKWSAMPVVLGVVAVLALGLVGVRVLLTGTAVASPDIGTARESGFETAAPLQTSGDVAPPLTDNARPLPAMAMSSAEPIGSDGSASPSEFGQPSESEGSVALSEVIPEVPRQASQTIRGRVKVSVRVIVEQDGTVFAALADNPGPSRYFERLALDAAKKWIFPPALTEDQRLMLVRFEFTRDGTTARAASLQ